MAASKPKRVIGCSVTAAALAGVHRQRQEPARLGAQRAVFGQITTRLAHQPDRRRVEPFAAKHLSDPGHGVSSATRTGPSITVRVR